MQIRILWKRFEPFECIFVPFEKDLKHSNRNSNYSKGIRNIQMQIRTIWKGFKVFECKFEPFKRDSIGIFEPFEKDLKHSNPNSNHSKVIRSIRIQIQTIWKGLEAFECKFEPFERDSKHSKSNSNHSFTGFETFERDSKHLNPFRSIRMEIQTFRKGF